MSRTPLRILALIASASALVLGGALPPSAADSLVGTPCPTLGARTGDGPGRTLVCQKKGKRQVWVLDVSGQTTDASCRKAPVFTRNFIDPASVQVVVPIGGQTGSGGVIAVRSYVHPLPSLKGQRLPIFAPTAMTLVGASYYRPADAPVGYQPEYSLYFSTACGYGVKFFHIKGVVGSVAKVVPSEPSTSSAGQQLPRTKVKAGEQIGWYEVGENSVAFDFWVDDPWRDNSFINPVHFTGSNALHAVCPYQYYTPALRRVWLAKLGSPGGVIVPGTSCGVVSQGAPGTADGMWFASPTTAVDVLATEGGYQSQIMLTTDPQGVVRIGGLNTSAVPAQMFVDRNSATWRQPSSVTVGQRHCWSDATQSVTVLVTSATTMSVAVGRGDCAAVGDPSAGRTYYR